MTEWKKNQILQRKAENLTFTAFILIALISLFI
jgi:hypothetical protein